MLPLLGAAVRLSDADFAQTYKIRFPAALAGHVIVTSGGVERVEPDDSAPTGGAGGKWCKGWMRTDIANDTAPGVDLGGPPDAASGLRARPAASAAGKAKQVEAIVLDDSDDDDDEEAALTQQQQRSRVNSAVVEDITIGAGFPGWKEQQQQKRMAQTAAGSTTAHGASKASAGTGRALQPATEVIDIDDDDDDDEDDDDDLLVVLPDTGASRDKRAPPVASCQNDSQQGESQVESQGTLLAPRGLYQGLYGVSRQGTGNSQNADSAGAASAFARTTSSTSASASASTSTSARRRPRLSGVIPPPAIGISWHNAILPTAGNMRTGAESQDPFDGGMTDSAGTASADAAAAAIAKEAGFQPPAFEPIIMPAGSFTIHLLIDTREVRGRGDGFRSNQMNQFASSLEQLGVPAETRALPLGDAVWIARRTGGGKGEEDEVVLDFVVERKRLDDLQSSIKDGRWREQKFRLASSGLSHVVYIVEDYNVDQQWDAFGESLQTALSSTQIIDGFFVERTPNVEATLKHLSVMHSVIKEKWEVSAAPAEPANRC